MLKKIFWYTYLPSGSPPSRRQRRLARHDARCAPPSGLHRLRNEQRGAWPSGGPAVAAVFKMEQEHARRARQCSARCIRDRSPVMPASPITFTRSRGSPTKPRRKSVPRHGCVISRSCCSPSMIALHSTIHCRARSSADPFMRSFRRRHQINRHPCSTAKPLFSRSQQTACDWFNAIARRPLLVTPALFTRCASNSLNSGPWFAFSLQ